MIDSLMAKPGDYFNDYQGNGNLNSRCLMEYEDTVLGVFTNIKEFDDYTFFPSSGHWLAKGLGLYFSQLCEFSCSSLLLKYAVINGIEYGKKITSIDRVNSQQPEKYFLYQNFPNPFNPSTTISYQVPLTCLVTIKVYDILGNEIRTLINEEKTSLQI